MNYTVNSLHPSVTNIRISEDPGINYTELGIFISGIILSTGGFIALILSNCRKSNCAKISCGCIEITRSNLDVDD
tara:strand:- start:751 stop:975 length:225 start_codon:yes stop_codon:yes gene_type:complete